MFDCIRFVVLFWISLLDVKSNSQSTYKSNINKIKENLFRSVTKQSLSGEEKNIHYWCCKFLTHYKWNKTIPKDETEQKPTNFLNTITNDSSQALLSPVTDGSDVFESFLLNYAAHKTLPSPPQNANTAGGVEAATLIASCGFWGSRRREYRSEAEEERRAVGVAT